MISWINSLLVSHLDRSTRRVVLLALAVAGTWLFVHWTDPYVRVDAAGGVLRLRVPATFRRLDVVLRESIGIVNATVGPERVPDWYFRLRRETAGARNLVLHRVDVDEQNGAFSIHNPPADASVPPSVDSFVAIDLPHRAKYPIDVMSMTLDGHNIPIDSIQASHVVNVGRRLMRYRLGQDWLERLVARSNEAIGNYVITAMVIVCLWMGLMVSPLTYQYYVPSKTRKLLAEQIPKDANIDKLNAARRDTFESYQSTAAAQRFLRVLGPALGFLFTVTSLVAGIRPESSVDGVRELGTLFSSLQLALISTVVGLGMRLVAMWRLRVERELLDRAADYYDEREREIHNVNAKNESADSLPATVS